MAENLGTVTLELDIGDVDQMIREALEDGADSLRDAGRGDGGPGGGSAPPPGSPLGGARIGPALLAGLAAATAGVFAVKKSVDAVQNRIREGVNQVDRTLQSRAAIFSPALIAARQNQVISEIGREFRRARQVGPATAAASREIEAFRDRMAVLERGIEQVQASLLEILARWGNSILDSDRFVQIVTGILQAVGLDSAADAVQNMWELMRSEDRDLTFAQINSIMLAEVFNTMDRKPEEFGLPAVPGFHDPLRPTQPPRPDFPGHRPRMPGLDNRMGGM